MKRKPNKPKQEPRERPGSWESAADPGGAAGGGSPSGAGAADSGTSGQSVHKSKFRQKSKQEQAAASKLRMEERGEKLERAKDKLAKQKPPKKPGPVRRIGRAAGGVAHGFVHGKIYENEQENVGIEGAHRSELVGESGLRHGKRFVQKKIRQHPAKAVQRAESKYVKATADYHFRMAAQEHPEMSGNPVSRMWRKHRLKKQYQKRAREAAKTGAASAAKKTAAATEKAGAKIAGFVKRHPVGVLLALACVLLLFMMQSCSSSLMMLGNSGAGAVGATTYPSEDGEILAAEAAYSGMEAELQTYLDTYTATHSYDEYHFDLDEIEHDPYNPKLTAARVALAKTESEIEKLLDTLSGANPLLLQYANNRIEELDAERQKQLKLVADLTANSVSASQIDSITGYLDDWESVSFDDKRKVVDILISQIDATSESVTIHWKI